MLADREGARRGKLRRQVQAGGILEAPGRVSARRSEGCSSKSPHSSNVLRLRQSSPASFRWSPEASLGTRVMTPRAQLAARSNICFTSDTLVF